MAWDCTAGEFHWYYTDDETVHIVTGSVRVTIEGRPVVTLAAGDVAYFPSGTHAIWRVENYVRKVAFLRKPLPLAFGLMIRVYWKALRISGLA